MARCAWRTPAYPAIASEAVIDHLGTFASSPRVTRRAVLVGGASALILAACAPKSSSEGSDDDKSTEQATVALAPLFGQNGYITAEVPQRVAFHAIFMDGSKDTTPPDPLEITITVDGHDPIVQQVQAHGRDLAPAPTYYPVHFTPPAGGRYTATATLDGQEVSTVFDVGDKGSSDIPGPGDALPAMVTPTTEDGQGVDPICTQTPECHLHAVSLDDALGEGRPVAYLVATPKFCQTGSCGPVLDVLEQVTGDYTDKVTFIHQEVYQSAKEAAEDGANAELTAPLRQMNMISEPVLYITGSDGVLAYRLDTVYDEAELRAALDDVTA